MPDLGPQATPGILAPFVQPAFPDSQEPVPGWVLRRQRKPALVCDSSILKVLVPKVTGGACFSSLLEPSLHPPCPMSLWTPLLLVLRFCGSRLVQLCPHFLSSFSVLSAPGRRTIRKAVSFMPLGTFSVPLGSETWVAIGGQTLSVTLCMLSPKMSGLK